MNPKELLTKFDEYLVSVGHSEKIELILCGGAVIFLSFDATRVTLDVDTLTALELHLKTKVTDFARYMNLQGALVPNDWLNDTVATRIRVGDSLKVGWVERARATSPLLWGKVHEVYGICREDLITSKVLAYYFDFPTMKISRHGVDLGDLVTMKSSVAEIVAIEAHLAKMAEIELDAMVAFLAKNVYPSLS